MAFIAKPLFILLSWIHTHVISNRGWAIILRTVIINLVTLPTRVTMMKSSIKMQRIQPQVEAIKKKHKKHKKYKLNDQRGQEMQQEISALQKKEGVNILGGCLPMLIQWPLLVAFYSMLSNVIELRQAHWLWLPDLSAPDPYHILPILFVLSMFLAQFLTPSTGVDRAQQRALPFVTSGVFGLMAWNYGSGLSLYWACGNIIGIIQQIAMNQTSLGRGIHENAARRAAEHGGQSQSS